MSLFLEDTGFSLVSPATLAVQWTDKLGLLGNAQPLLPKIQVLHFFFFLLDVR